MSRFSVYSTPSGQGYIMDIQADAISHFNTRIVVPLMPQANAPKPATTLNPIFVLNGESFIMVTQYMAAIPVKELTTVQFNLQNHHAEIVAAIDLLLQGF